MTSTDAGYTAKSEDLQDAKDATQGLRDTKDAKQAEVNPVLLAQAEDEYYLTQGLEFVAFDNWSKADEQLNNAR